jgi:chaperonin GroES
VAVPPVLGWADDRLANDRTSTEPSFGGQWRASSGREGVETVQFGEKNAMKIRPLADRVLVRRMQEEEKSKGGIIIPDTAREKPTEAKVVAVGKGKVGDDGRPEPMTVKVGDRVLLSRWGGSEVKLEGEEHLIVREDEIYAIIEA